MTRLWINVALVRIIFPTLLVLCTIWRPVGLSLVYLVLALASPLVPVPTYISTNEHHAAKPSRRFLLIAISLSLFVALIQLAFQIFLLIATPYGHFIKNCEFVERLLRHIGLVRLDKATPWEFFVWLTPELVILPSSITIYYTSRRLIQVAAARDDESFLQRYEKKSKDRSTKIINCLGSIGTYVVLASLCFTASLNPSVEGGFYFVVFIASATWWALNRELRRGFALVCRVLMLVVTLHIAALLSYQNQWPQEYLSVNGTWARYFALMAATKTNCQDPREPEYVQDNVMPLYAYTLRLFLLYFILALQSKFLFQKPASAEAKQRTRLSGKLDTLDTPLSRHVSIRKRTASQRWQSARRKARKPIVLSQPSHPNERTPLMRFGSGRTGLLQDSTGSVIVQDGQQDDSIQMQSLSDGAPEENTGILEHIIMAVFSIFQLIVNSSYLATNIIMMTWSIMYHSWTTFVLLLWALVLWMVPNKRASMIKCSRFIVFYSTILIIIQYVYTMNLTEEELPTVIHGIKMSDIGFKKTSELSCWHLIVKCLFLTMFWITMRQYSAERMRQRRSSTLRDMVAPLHVSVSAATTAMNNQAEPEIKSQFMKDVGVVLKRLFTKFWIAVVAMMLFTSGITGERMTVFRIVYMTLFLLFIITFQISWIAWRKMMYGFWITVIGYSVIMLILVYTYQFPDFPEYWEKYLHISRTLQQDIGLIIYDTKDLFVRLLTPTFFVIISVLQIHYFHDDFLEITNLKKISDVTRKDSLGHSPSTIPIVSPTEVFISENEDISHVFTLKELKEMSKLERIVLMRRISGYLYEIYNYLWLFLELHIQKIIFIAFVIFCIKDICAINFCFIVTIVISINFRRSAQIMVINFMAMAIAVLMVIEMLYQIDYIKHDDWNRNCTKHIPGNSSEDHTTKNITYNIAEWIGLRKVNADTTLSTLLDGPIYLIILTTFRAVIMVRQWFHRQEKGEHLETPLFMFPDIKRADADKGLLPCFKFLCNYGFYKFGLEFCLIGMVALIGTRLDFYSVLYSIWLMILFSLNRKTTSKVWPFLKLFAIVILPLQYAMNVAPPPWLCIDYPWQYSEILKRLQEWMFLPNPDDRPNPNKLMCDFILLMMIVRQSLVFRIEQRSVASGQEFVAGHNYSVYKEMEKPNFVNPVKDYVSHIHNWLDVFKRGSMMSLMWITLAFMFLAGTKRTNLFSVGYLVGAFVFLWQGSDFYLRPVNTILKWWNILIGYNIFVIFGKTVFQGIGCIFIQNLETAACWLIQLLGVACLNKFDQLKPTSECDVDRDDIGMFWDGLCFAFLIIQKRLFRSYYFFYIIDETKAMSILASRGAELLEELHQKRIVEQENLEKAVLQKIKFKMDKIKANQRKIHGPNYKEPKTHKIEGEAPLARTSSMSSCVSSTRTPPQGYRTPIDDDDDEEEEEEDEPSPLTPRAASLLQAPSPNSAIMTVSLEGYLEPGRISFGSPPNSELNPRGPSPDESSSVFSPLPYGTRRPGDESVIQSHRRQSSYAESSWTIALGTPRRSILSTASRSHRSYHTYSLYKPLERPMYMRRAPKTHVEAVRSGDYYMFDDMDDDDLTDFYPEKDHSDEEIRRREKDQRGRRMTVSELMNTLIKTDIEIATHVALYGGTEKDAMKIRRRSVPLTRKKSSMSYLSARSDTDTAAATDLPEQETLTSSDEDATEREFDELDKTSEKSEEKKDGEEKEKVSFFTYFRFLWAFLNSTMVSMTRYLNRYSSDYRYIRKVLAKEKKLLKAKPDFRMGTRLGISQIWQPIVKPKSSREENSEDIIEDPGEGPSNREDFLRKRKESSLSVPHIRILAPSMERGLDTSSSSSLLARGIQTHEEEDDEAVLSEVDQPPIIQLAASIWFGILAHSTFLCYFMVFLHQIKNASLLSTPLPLMVFLWGSLTIPRPSKTFWITIIAYVEVLVIIKCICQPAFLSWNTRETAKILGVERKPNYALWDLMLLLVVFFHRYMLKSLGQWTTPSANSRKVIPTGLTMATVRQSSIEENNKNNLKHEACQAGTAGTVDSEVVTPKGRVLNLQSNTQPPSVGDNERLVVIHATEKDTTEDNFQKAIRLTILKHLEPIKIFFDNILDPNGKEKTNVYVYMFLCDFFNFVLLIFGFSSFDAQQADGGVATYFAENRVPKTFLFMLLFQFALIVIDRALYLKKAVSKKLAFQYFLVIIVHIWMFLILPSVTERSFNTRTVPQIWYMVKCFYLLLAAYQLRLGYPTRILGNFLCQNFTVVHYTLFKGFMVVPFLFEMRAVMDWIWTDTSMTVMDWFKMEDIFANIYQIKCMRRMESDYPQERGVKKKQLSKYLVGGGALFLMIGMIWFPLLIFALGSTVGDSNLPREVSLNIRIGSYEPIYSIAAQNSSIIEYSEKDYNKLKELYEMKRQDRAAVTFLENYESSDIVAVKLSTESGRLWNISPPDKNRLKEELQSDNVMMIHVEWTVIARRAPSKEVSGITSNFHNIRLDPYVNGERNPTRQALLDALNGLERVEGAEASPNATSNSVLLKNALPMFVKVTSGATSVVQQLMKPLLPDNVKSTYGAQLDEPAAYNYRDVTLVVSNNSVNQQWFAVRETCNDTIFNKTLNRIPHNDCSFIMMFLFNDKVFPETLSFISGLGIFGLYTTAVILVSSFTKRIVSDMAPKIMFEDLPYVDRILRLCLDIYLVRESGDLCLEEDLFAKLVFLFRSPETLIRWTRPPEPGEQTDGNEDDQNYDEIDNDGADDDDNDDDEQDTIQLRRRRED